MFCWLIELKKKERKKKLINIIAIVIKTNKLALIFTTTRTQLVILFSTLMNEVAVCFVFC
jgi:hypothetical protein